MIPLRDCHRPHRAGSAMPPAAGARRGPSAPVHRFFLPAVLPPVLRGLLTALVLAPVLLAPLPVLAQGQSGGQPSGETPRVQGLPPAPPPSGIRPSRPRDQAVRESGPAPRRAATEALGEPLVLEIRDLPQETADAALRAAVEAIRKVETLVDPEGPGDGPGLAALNAAAGEDPIPVDPDLVAILERALSFCRWSDRAHGPLGGELYRLWGLREPAPGRPTPGRLEAAARSAACDRVAVERGKEGDGEVAASAPRAQLAEGSRLDLWGFVRGFAVDRAVEVLRREGATNAFVELGPVRRALGAGPDGRGWPVVLPVFPGQPRPLDRVWLLDQSLAVSSAVHNPLLVAGDRYAPYVDQRSGEPAAGVMGVVAVSELAVDAEALSASMMILGHREGLLRVGGLKPSPHVLWLLGAGTGAPVLSQYNWTEISLR